MSTDTIISALPGHERTALGLCGITQDAQLAGIAPDKLLRDLEQAAQFFPDQLATLPSPERLQELCARAVVQMEALTKAGPADNGSEEEDSVLPKVLGQNLPIFQPARHSRHRHSQQAEPANPEHEEGQQIVTLSETQPAKPKDDPRDFTHSIYCMHPFATYFGAWATLALVASCFVIAYVLFQLLIGIKLTSDHILCAKIMVGVVVVYYLFLRAATCSTCRIGVFSFRRYPRHRQAHHFPLLGYTIPTALSVIFCLRYRCPSCGTPQKLYGHSHRRRRHI